MEAIAEPISARTLGQLENYFSSYGDLPREIILKHDLLRVGHWFTDAALELASQALVKSYRLFSYDLMAMKDMKRDRKSTRLNSSHVERSYAVFCLKKKKT